MDPDQPDALYFVGRSLNLVQVCLRADHDPGVEYELQASGGSGSLTVRRTSPTGDLLGIAILANALKLT